MAGILICYLFRARFKIKIKNNLPNQQVVLSHTCCGAGVCVTLHDRVKPKASAISSQEKAARATEKSIHCVTSFITEKLRLIAGFKIVLSRQIIRKIKITLDFRPRLVW
jgi:hypothetical protein